MPQTMNTLLFVGTQLAVTALTYAYYALLGRFLSAEDFARYAALTAIFTVYTVIGIALTQAAARATVLGMNQIDLERQTMRLAYLATALTALSSLVLSALTGLPLWWLAGLALLALPYALLSVRRGVLLAHGRVAALAVSFAAEHGGKIVLTALLAAVMPLIDAAALALALSLALAYIALAIRIPRAAPSTVTTSVAATDEDFGRDTLSIGSATLAQLLTANADLLIAQTLLPGAAGALYATSALVARVVLIGSSAVQSASIAQLARQPGGNRNAARLMYGLILAGGAGFVVIALTFGATLMQLAFGERYASAAALLPYLGLAALGFALAHARLQHRIALGERLAGALGFAGVGVQVFALLIAHRDALSLAQMQCAAGIVFFAIVWVFGLKRPVQQGGQYVVPSF
jgi:O-antigen/teichoic acid export membrane protein